MHFSYERDAFYTSVMQCDAFSLLFYKLHFSRKDSLILACIFAIL